MTVVDVRNPSRVRNMPVPTLGGVLPCRYDPAIASFNVRTWLRRVMSARLDATADALHGWVEAGRGQPPARRKGTWVPRAVRRAVRVTPPR
ncbi:hypothetical protein [Novilysobacter arseniciresistens]|uniref:hypothetical protein n=1 Tax=Novilysobacter arseniciresistens TaxID=1385522 RepID=UPI00126A3E21|nr:hypothetical protein [Lysobacter arseniciresistens]